MDKRLLLLVLILGCAGGKLGAEKNPEGISILAFEPDIGEVAAGDIVNLRLQIQNNGDFIARNIEAKLFKLSDFEQKTPEGALKFSTLNPPDPVAELEGEINEKYWQLKASSQLEKNQEVVQEIGVKISFGYEATARAEFSVMDRQTYKEYQQKKKLPEPVYESSVSPVNLKFSVPEATLANVPFTLKLDVSKATGGFVGTSEKDDMTDKLESIEITYDSDTLEHVASGCDFCDETTCATADGKLTIDDPNSLNLWEDGTRSYSCDFEVKDPGDVVEAYPSISAKAKYTYTIEKTAPVTVIGLGIAKEKLIAEKEPTKIAFVSKPSLTAESGKTFYLPTWQNPGGAKTNVVCNGHKSPVCEDKVCKNIEMILTLGKDVPTKTYTCMLNNLGAETFDVEVTKPVAIVGLDQVAEGKFDILCDDRKELQVGDKYYVGLAGVKEGYSYRKYKLSDAGGVIKKELLPLKGKITKQYFKYDTSGLAQGAYTLEVTIGAPKPEDNSLSAKLKAALGGGVEIDGGIIIGKAVSCEFTLTKAKVVEIAKEPTAKEPGLKLKDDDGVCESGAMQTISFDSAKSFDEPIDCGCIFYPHKLEAGEGQKFGYSVQLPLDLTLADDCLAEAVKSCHQAVAPGWWKGLNPYYMCYENVYFPNFGGYKDVPNAFSTILQKNYQEWNLDEEKGAYYFNYDDELNPRDPIGVQGGTLYDFDKWYWYWDADDKVVRASSWYIDQKVDADDDSAQIPGINTDKGGKRVRAEILFEDIGGRASLLGLLTGGVAELIKDLIAENAVTLHTYEWDVDPKCNEVGHNSFVLSDSDVVDCMQQLIETCYKIGQRTSGSKYKAAEAKTRKCFDVDTSAVATVTGLDQIYPKSHVADGRLSDISYIEHEGRYCDVSEGTNCDIPLTRGSLEVQYNARIEGWNDVKLITKEPRRDGCDIPKLEGEVDGKAEFTLPADKEDAKHCLALAISNCHEAFKTGKATAKAGNADRTCYKVYASAGKGHMQDSKKQGLTELVYLVATRYNEFGETKAPAYVRYVNTIDGVEDNQDGDWSWGYDYFIDPGTLTNPLVRGSGLILGINVVPGMDLHIPPSDEPVCAGDHLKCTKGIAEIKYAEKSGIISKIFRSGKAILDVHQEITYNRMDLQTRSDLRGYLTKCYKNANANAGAGDDTQFCNKKGDGDVFVLPGDVKISEVMPASLADGSDDIRVKYVDTVYRPSSGSGSDFKLPHRFKMKFIDGNELKLGYNYIKIISEECGSFDTGESSSLSLDANNVKCMPTAIAKCIKDGDGFILDHTCYGTVNLKDSVDIWMVYGDRCKTDGTCVDIGYQDIKYIKYGDTYFEPESLKNNFRLDEGQYLMKYVNVGVGRDYVEFIKLD